ncbi:F-box protein, partial [Trifolium medium]|nr:F-box protein [Trifolium medium]
ELISLLMKACAMTTCTLKRSLLLHLSFSPYYSITAIWYDCIARMGVGQRSPKEKGYKTITVGHEVFSGERLSFLVESEGELLLVAIYEYFDFENSLRIRVLRLDEKEKWVQLTSLGDRILFLGNGCSFSASTSDLSVSKGNCIIFMDDVFDEIGICDNDMCVFDFDQDRLSLLSEYPEYHNLFWPPPKWIVKSCMLKTKKSMLSCI